MQSTRSSNPKTVYATGEFDDSLVILLSDHGEAFFEHGEFLHTKSLYREGIHVPLIVKWPAGTKGYRQRVEEAVSLVDVAPTLAAFLGMGPPSSAAGNPLAEVLP